MRHASAFLVGLAALLVTFAGQAKAAPAGRSALPWSVTELAPDRSACPAAMAPTDAQMLAYLERSTRGLPRGAQVIAGVSLRDQSVVLLDALGRLAGKTQLPAQAAPCGHVFCVAERLFGDVHGVPLLYLMVRYGYNGSHLATRGTSPWTRAQLDEILAVLSDLPPGLVTAVGQDNAPFVQGPVQPGASASALSIIGRADFGVRLAPGWSGLPEQQRRAVIVHEVAHNIHAALDHPALDATGARISRYAATNGREDFAETVTAYRYAPQRLKAASPRRYAFLRSVFGVEYVEASGCAGPAARSADVSVPDAPASAQALEVLRGCGAQILGHYAEPAGARRIASPIGACLLRRPDLAGAGSETVDRQVLAELRALFTRAMMGYLAATDGAAADHCRPTLSIDRFFRNGDADAMLGEGFSFRQNMKLAFIARQICDVLARSPGQQDVNRAVEQVMAG